MRKTLLLLSFLLTSLMTFAATNLTSGKTVYPLGGLKAFLPEGSVTTEKLQKITVDDNTDNVFLFPENGDNLEYNKTLGIQGFYIDLGEAKSIGAIQSTWEGADCGANIYVTNTAPAADGSLTGETLIATFTNAQESKKDAAVAVTNSGRYIVFVPTEATNYAWGVKIRTFVALEKEASVLTSLDVTPTMVKVGEATEMTFTAKDQLGVTLTEGVTYTATNATLVGTTLTATAVGDVKITATYNAVSVDKIIQAIDVSAPTTNPTEPTDLAANVIAVYSAKYGKGINESNPTWGVGGGAPNPLYISIEEVEIADAHKVVHVNGTGFNSRTAGGVGVTSDYTQIHVAVYPFTATEAKFFGDNAYGKAISKTGLVPGQWNYLVFDNTNNQPNYALIELVGESEFYLDHFYFAKPAVDDDEAPVLNTAAVKSAGIGSVTFTLKATDNKSAKVTYVINDGTKDYTTKGDNGVEITYTVGGLDFNKAYTFSIIAKDDNENASDAQNVNATTLALTAAPAPSQDADDVISLYSNAYTAASTYTYGEWGQSTTVEAETVGEDNILKLSNFNYLGFELATQLDLKDMEYVHIDVLPMQDMTVGITPIMTGGIPTEKPTSVGELTPGEWNSKDIKLSEFGLDFANSKAFQLKLDKGTGKEIVYVDNIYFWKEASAPVVVTAITVEAAKKEVAVGKTLQLTVKDQTEAVVAASELDFTSGTPAVATVDADGKVTGVAEGNVRITASLKSDATIKNTIDLTVVAAPVGLELTADGHTILVQGTHYLDRSENNWKLVITSDDDMNGLGGPYWGLSGGNEAMNGSNCTVSDDKKMITVLATSTTKPTIYTPLYVMMPGEVNFGNIGADDITWVEEGEETVNVIVTGDVATVTGPVTATDVATIITDAGAVATIDFSGATITEAITITPANKNAVVVVGGTGRTPDANGAKVTASNLVVFDGIYRRAADGVVINLVDDNDSQPAYDFVIDAQQDGITYTRTVAAGAWASFNAPASVTVPDGVDVYKATDAAADEVTFTKQASQAVGANDPVILHNTTGADVVITTETAKIDLNLTANGAGTTIGTAGVTQFGTSRAIDTDGTQYALKDGNLHPFSGAKIGAFRVYFTGLSGASARAIFDDGDVTGIKGIKNMDELMNGKFYNLQGQEVKNPTKGIFIVNGKKVILK